MANTETLVALDLNLLGMQINRASHSDGPMLLFDSRLRETSMLGWWF